METWADAAWLKDDLIKDLRDWYKFEPNRSVDVCAMMRHYLHETEYENRPEVMDGIMDSIGRWMKNEPYPDPTAWQHKFDSTAAANELERLLDEYLEDVAAADDPAALAVACKEKVQALDEKHEGYLMDTWRRETLHELFEGTVALAQAPDMALAPAPEPEPEQESTDMGGQQMGGM